MSDDPLERLMGEPEPRDPQGGKYVITPKGVIFLHLTEMGLEYEKALEVAEKIERDIIMAGYVYQFAGVEWDDDETSTG